MPEERKLVTVVFADVTGSTAMAGELDPEDVRALMFRYYEHARRVVGAHGGTLEKFIGDAIMAVFGLPQAHGDDAERAVAATLALRHAVADDSLLASVLLRIGVNTGEVIASTDPSRTDFLITGDTVNVAARLQQSANPGEILVAARTMTAAMNAFVFDAGRELQVRGKTDALRVFAVLEARSTRKVERPALIGRKQDLLQLELLRSRTLEESRPQLVSIVAPAGTGKTRLLEEFLRSVDPHEGIGVALARCLPYGETLTYWPLRGLLEDLVDAADRRHVVDAFVQNGHDDRDANRLADLILATLGIESDRHSPESHERESIFNAWRLLIEGLARQTPRIVVFEDLHWASDSLLDLVEHILHPRTQASLLIIATSRPELLDRRPTWGSGGRQSFTALALQPLNQSQTAELVTALGSRLLPAVRDRIVDRSGGNPFFAIEIVRGPEERGAQDFAAWTGNVPDTVHAAVLGRLDLVNVPERKVLQAAAVTGRSFRSETVQALVEDLGPEDIDTALDGLLARDLVVPDDAGAYTFRHILIRDVAYGTLSRAERIRMHSAVAAWLDRHAAKRPDEFAELIAHHYREAARLARRSAVALPLPFDPTRAVRFLERAAELASRAGAAAEAREHLRSAIELAPIEEHQRLFEKLGDLATVGLWSAEAYEKALQLWRNEGQKDPLTGARLLRKLLTFRMREHVGAVELKHEEITAMRSEAQTLAHLAGDEDEIWRVRVADLFWPWWRFDITPEEAATNKEVAEEAADYFERRGDWMAFSQALDGLSANAILTGAHEVAITASKRRLGAADLPLRERGDALHMISDSYIYQGNYQAAVNWMREVLANIRPGDPILHLSQGPAWTAFAACISGLWSDLDTLAPVLQEMQRQTRFDPAVGAGHQGYFAVLHVALAREDRAGTDAASSVLRQNVEHGRRIHTRSVLDAYATDDPGDLDVEAVSRRGIGGLVLPRTLSLMFLSERGVAAAPILLDTIAHDAIRFDFSLRCLRVAQALRLGDPEQLTDAIVDAENHGLIPHAARMRIVLAQITGDPAPLEQARAALGRLGDRQFLRRLDEVAASLRGGHMTEPHPHR